MMIMKKVGFFVVKCWTGLMSITPYWLLYLKSDLLYLLVYHVFRYRRKVVRQNLLRSFPEKEIKEIRAIERHFYQNLCDQIEEIPKVLNMGPNGYKYRVNITNPELITALYEQQKSLFYAIPHSGNWEWAGKMLPELSPHKCLAVYKMVKNPVFEQLMLYLRTKDCAVEMIESDAAARRLIQLRNETCAVLMMADQTPHGLNSDYWTEFLHQDTCWFTGLERVAKMLDYAVVFVDMKRHGRGRYEVKFCLISDNTKETEKGYIMEQYVRKVERFIQEQPDNWLWSHRRWKHQRNQESK